MRANACTGQCCVEASRAQPCGNSQLSPCQCSTGVAPSADSTEAWPASVSVNGAQPISLTGPGATRAPSAAAMSCAPRQMPSIGLFDSMRAATAAISSPMNG